MRKSDRDQSSDKSCESPVLKEVKERRSRECDKKGKRVDQRVKKRPRHDRRAVRIRSVRGEVMEE